MPHVGYFDPFPISAHIASVAYNLHLPNTARINPGFHISLLKFLQTSSQPYVILPLTTNELGPPVKVLNLSYYNS